MAGQDSCKGLIPGWWMYRVLVKLGQSARGPLFECAMQVGQKDDRAAMRRPTMRCWVAQRMKLGDVEMKQQYAVLVEKWPGEGWSLGVFYGDARTSRQGCLEVAQRGWVARCSGTVVIRPRPCTS